MLATQDDKLKDSSLSKQTTYPTAYDATQLFPIERRLKRDAIGVPVQLPFLGQDVWRAYEVSWLNKNGMPVNALAAFGLPCTTTCLIESKSLKLYFNSFNETQFDSMQTVQEVMTADLSAAAQGDVSVTLYDLSLAVDQLPVSGVPGSCLDRLSVSIDDYTVQPDHLFCHDASETAMQHVEEVLYSDCLKSNCPVTNQPDWGTVVIAYRGKPIDHAGLLKYIVSFRRHQEFHEQCVERIFMEVMSRCAPEALCVMALYTRRGGLDINPIRYTPGYDVLQVGRTVRQ